MNNNLALNKVDYCEDFRSFVDYLEEHYKDRDALSIYDAKGKITTLSYHEFCERVIDFAAFMQQENFSEKHIAILSENSIEWLICAFAGAYIGAVVVCIDTEQPDETILSMIQQADCEVVFFTSTFNHLKEGFGAIAISYQINDPFLFSNLLLLGKNSEAAQKLIRTKPIDPKACSFIYYTSGTTSTSKPVMLSQRSILYNAIDSMAVVKVSGKLYTSLPFYHTYGFTCSVLDVMSQGLSICINGNLKTSIRDLALFGPDYLMAVPLLVETLFKYISLEIKKAGLAEEFEDFYKPRTSFFASRITEDRTPFLPIIHKICGPQLKMIVCGGAHISDQLIHKFDKLNIMVLQGYGITECSPLVSVNSNSANVIGSVGVVLPHYQVKICDNEIYIKGDSLMIGYYKDSLLTDEAFDDSWFKSGDLGFQDKQGYLYITGRKKNLIVFKNGKKVSPEEIESYFEKIPIVREVLAHGTVNGISADDVKLTVTVYPDPIISNGMSSYEILEELQSAINEINLKLPSYKQIQMVKVSENPLPKTSLNKIKRN